MYLSYPIRRPCSNDNSCIRKEGTRIDSGKPFAGLILTISNPWYIKRVIAIMQKHFCSLWNIFLEQRNPVFLEELVISNYSSNLIGKVMEGDTISLQIPHFFRIWLFGGGDFCSVCDP